MNTLWKLLQKHSNLILFILLETIAFSFVFSTNNGYQHAAFFSACNGFVGTLNNTTKNIARYFSLDKQNAALVAENNRLRNENNRLQNHLRYCQEYDSAYIFSDMDYEFIYGKVIRSSINQEHNFLTLNKGLRDGVRNDMAVMCERGVVGIVANVSEKFAVTIPIIHNRFNLGSKIKNTDIYGNIRWNEKNYHYAQMHDVARHTRIRLGDTIVTSDFSSHFPPDIPIGKIVSFDLDKDDTYYAIEVELFVDYKKLTHVYVLKNNNNKEIIEVNNGMD